MVGKADQGLPLSEDRLYLSEGGPLLLSPALVLKNAEEEKILVIMTSRPSGARAEMQVHFSVSQSP